MYLLYSHEENYKIKKNNMIFVYLYEESEKNPVHLVSAEK